MNTPEGITRDIADRFRSRRLSLSMTQQEVAERSGVSLGSLKRFERAGLVAFDSLLRIAFVLGCLGDFDRVCAADLTGKTLDDLIGEPRKRQRGTSPHKRSR